MCVKISTLVHFIGTGSTPTSTGQSLQSLGSECGVYIGVGVHVYQICRSQAHVCLGIECVYKHVLCGPHVVRIHRRLIFKLYSERRSLERRVAGMVHGYDVQIALRISEIRAISEGYLIGPGLESEHAIVDHLYTAAVRGLQSERTDVLVQGEQLCRIGRYILLLGCPGGRMAR